jgi:hypothetical protein
MLIEPLWFYIAFAVVVVLVAGTMWRTGSYTKGKK